MDISSWLNNISVPDWWMGLGGDKRKALIKKKYGVEWDDISNVGKEMIYKKEVKGESVSESKS